MAQPWERQEGESGKAFAAFCCFRDLGPKRSIVAAYMAYTGRGEGESKARVPGFFERWSASKGWQSRAMAFDKYLHDEALQCLKERREAHIIRLWDSMREAIDLQVERIREASFDELTRWYNSMRSSIQAFDNSLEAPDVPDSITAGPDGPSYSDPWMPKDDEGDDKDE